MAFDPQFAIVTPEAIPDNLLAFIADATRQKEALTLAGLSSLKLIKNRTSTVANRLNPVYPSIAFVDDNDAADYAEDVIQSAYSATFEVSIQHKNPDVAVSQARIYRRALKLLIRNIPDADVLTDTGCTTAVLQTMEGGFDAIKTNEKQNDFLQTFQLRMTYTLTASAYQ